MTHRMFALAIAALALAGPLTNADAQNWNDSIPDAALRDNAGHRMTSVVCQSIQYRPATCPADTQNNVRLVNVLGGDCVQGRTWTFDRRAIYVRNGCRAVFNAGRNIAPGGPGWAGGGYNPGYGGPPQQALPTGLITCQSWNYAPATCPADTRGSAVIAKRLGGNCVLGRNWSFDRRAIYVREGCRATFAVAGAPY